MIINAVLELQTNENENQKHNFCVNQLFYNTKHTP